MGIDLTGALRKEYTSLFNTCEIRPDKLEIIDSLVGKIVINRNRYEAVGTPLSIPWFFIGAIHNMESSLRFTEHLHNGDPLTARTVHVPKNRPLAGSPPFTWEASATDALTLDGLNSVKDWSTPGILFQLEKYNGFGYRTKHPEVLSPYLWSYSNHYISGKYVQDGTFDPNASSDQCGAAVILRRMAESHVIQFNTDGNPIITPRQGTASVVANLSGPLVTYSESTRSDAAATLQRALNTLPGVFLLVDGVPGRRTSDAFQLVTGHFLNGDPRAQSAAADSPR